MRRSAETSRGSTSPHSCSGRRVRSALLTPRPSITSPTSVTVIIRSLRQIGRLGQEAYCISLPLPGGSSLEIVPSTSNPRSLPLREKRLRRDVLGSWTPRRSRLRKLIGLGERREGLSRKRVRTVEPDEMSPDDGAAAHQ